jgi:hypothetical protein
MSAKIRGKMIEVLLIATLAGAEMHQTHQEELADQLNDRALEDWGQDDKHSESTALDHSVSAKTDMGSTPDGVGAKPAPVNTCNSTNDHMKIDADWSLCSCSTAVSGELTHDVAIGISNESEYTTGFEKMVKDQFQAGMEFAIGPLVKNKLTGEGRRSLESAFSTSSEQETTEGVACEVFGGTWCMWQWRMTFEYCGNNMVWNSPITECKRGMGPPKPPEGIQPAISTVEPHVGMMALFLASLDLTNSWFVLAMSLAAASLAVTLRHLRAKDMNVEEPLYA